MHTSTFTTTVHLDTRTIDVLQLARAVYVTMLVRFTRFTTFYATYNLVEAVTLALTDSLASTMSPASQVGRRDIWDATAAMISVTIEFLRRPGRLTLLSHEVG